MGRAKMRSASSSSASVGAKSKTKAKGRAQPAKGSKNKIVYFFAAGQTEGNAKMKELLGGKGANLAEMTALGLPVPPGFTITTAVCNQYYAAGKTFPAGL